MKTKKNSGDFPFHALKLYILLAFIAFFPCLVLGRAYFDNDLLAQFGPWRLFLKDQLAQGRFPLWNPYCMGGEPFFANLQNMMLYPVNYLTLPFPVAYGLSVFFFLHMILAAFGTHLWLRSLDLPETACRVGAVLFASSNFFWLEVIHPPVLAAFAWTPWFFWGLEEWTKKPRPGAAFGAGLSYALLFLSGSFQIAVGALYGGAAYFLYRVIARLKPGKPSGLTMALFFLWGALPLLAQFIPTSEFAALTNRASDQDYLSFNSKLSLEPSSLHQFLFPHLLLPDDSGLSLAVQNHQNGEDFVWAGNWGYLGIWALPLLLFAFPRKKLGLSFFLGGFLLFWLAVSLGSNAPLHRFLCDVLPGFSLLKVPYRFLFLYLLGAAALTAIGFDGLFSTGKKSRLRDVFITLGLLLFTASAAGGLQTWRETLALILGLASMILFHLRPSLKKAGMVLFQAALILPLFLHGWADFQTGPPSNFDFEKNSKSIPGINSSVKPYRILFNASNLKYPITVHGKSYLVNYPQNASCALKIKNFGGYNPLVLQTKMDITNAGLEPLVHLGAIKGILTQDNGEEIPGFKLESFPPYLFHEYQKPLSWAYAPEKAHIVPDGEMRVAILAKSDFDITQQVIFSEPPPFPQKPPAVQGENPLEVKLDLDDPEYQSLSVNLSRDNWVVFPEIMFPGWKALADGRETPVVTADHLLRAVYLTAGKHRVEFRYDPYWWGPLRAGLLLWVLITLGYVYAHRTPARKSKRA